MKFKQMPTSHSIIFDQISNNMKHYTNLVPTAKVSSFLYLFKNVQISTTAMTHSHFERKLVYIMQPYTKFNPEFKP